jgi:hypothetical protein
MVVCNYIHFDIQGLGLGVRVRDVVFNTTFNNISVILVGET